MEEELIRLEKELDDLDNIEGDVWGYIYKWEKKFERFVGKNKSKYGWCEDEFKKIHSINNGIKFPKDSFRGYIDSYKKLFEKIKSKE